MNHTQRPIANRGGAMVLAVAVLGLVAAAIVALTSVATGEFRRTQNEEKSLQLEQYQLAAIVIAQDQLKSGKPINGPLPLPEWAPSAECRWTTTDARQAECVIMIDHTARKLMFANENGTWTLAASHSADVEK